MVGEMAIERVVWGNAMGAWLEAGWIAFGTLAALVLFHLLLRSQLARWARRTPSLWDDRLLGVVRATRWWFFVVVALFVGTSRLELPPRAHLAMRAAAVLALLLQAALWAERAIAATVERARASGDASRKATVEVIAFVGRVALWSIVVLLGLANLGIDVTALVTGLGIGGVAVALAAQNFLGDLVASLAIGLDRPFAIGDFIEVGGFSGTVEKVGWKTTRLRSLSGEQLVFSNNDLLGSRLRNFERMEERRVLLGFGVDYATALERLEEIPALARALVEREPLARFERAHLKGFGDSALLFEVVYFVRGREMLPFMDVQQRVNLGLCRALAERGIGFAFPTRTLHLEPGARPLSVSVAPAAGES